MKVLIVGSSKFPIPAVKGGAVPYLIEELIQEQNIQNKLELYCCTLWDEKAEIAAMKYDKTKFIWAKVPKWINNLDKLTIYIMKNLFRIKRLLSIGYVFQIFWFSFFVGKCLKKNNFDKVIFENSIPMLNALRFYNNRRKYKGKYYIHMHSVPRKYFGNEKIFSECNKLVSISDYVSKQILSNPRISLKQESVYMMYNCIDTNIMRPYTNLNIKTIREKYNIPLDKRLILFAGRLCKEKGIEEVIKSLIMLDNCKVFLLIVGANFYNSGIISPYEKYLKELADPVKEQLVFTGYVDYKEMPLLYNISDCVVLPSMWDEPAGMTIIEAMACQKPVITTISGGIPEYTGEQNCILIDKQKNVVEKITESIKLILDNENYSQLLSIKGYERAVRFNRNYYYKQLLNLLFEGNNYEKV